MKSLPSLNLRRIFFFTDCFMAPGNVLSLERFVPYHWPSRSVNNLVIFFMNLKPPPFLASHFFRFDFRLRQATLKNLYKSIFSDKHESSSNILSMKSSSPYKRPKFPPYYLCTHVKILTTDNTTTYPVSWMTSFTNCKHTHARICITRPE